MLCLGNPAAFPAVHEVCTAEFRGMASYLLFLLWLSLTVIKLASDAGDFNCKWVFAEIFFTADHICGAEVGTGTRSHGTACMSESMVVWLTPSTKSFDLVTLFLKLRLPNWSSAKAPHLSNLIIPYICVLTQMHSRRSRLDVHMYHRESYTFWVWHSTFWWYPCLFVKWAASKINLKIIFWGKASEIGL